MVTDALFSSGSSEWETPQWLYDSLNAIFRFELDAAASAENAKCVAYWDHEANGLKKPWASMTWLNPPYGREIGQWLEKATQEARDGNTTVCLLPSRTDTKWFHEYVYDHPNVKIDFLRGRLKFGGSKNSAPFPSMIVTFRPLREAA